MSENETAAAVKPKRGEATSEPVKMTDGRVVEFVGKRQLVKESLVNDAGKGAVRLDFRNGETRLFVIPDSLLLKFATHGAEQKLGDETAGVKDIDDMVLYVDELMDRLNKGEWSAAREGGGVSGASTLIRAIMEVTGKTQEQVRAYLDKQAEALKVSKQALTNALRVSDQLKPVVDRLEAEKAKKAAGAVPDAGSLLAGLSAAE